jgi:lysophospholipase L1-like esterase
MEPDQRPDPLARWRAGGPNGKTICFLGDSTTAVATNFHERLRTVHCAPGGVLAGAETLNYGDDGSTLAAFLADTREHGITVAIAAQPDLYVLCYGLNDVRREPLTMEQFRARIAEAIDRLRAGAPNADILLRTPNLMLSQNTSYYVYLQPDESAQVYTDRMRDAYLGLQGRWPNVLVWDAMAEVFGTESIPTHPLLADQLHPNAAGEIALADALVQVIAPGGARIEPV